MQNWILAVFSAVMPSDSYIFINILDITLKMQLHILIYQVYDRANSIKISLWWVVLHIHSVFSNCLRMDY